MGVFFGDVKAIFETVFDREAEFVGPSFPDFAFPVGATAERSTIGIFEYNMVKLGAIAGGHSLGFCDHGFNLLGWRYVRFLLRVAQKQSLMLSEAL